MNIRNPKSAIRGPDARVRACAFGFRASDILRLSAFGFLILSGHASSSSPSADDIPPLAPPLPEIQPTFWEQHGLLVLAGSLVAVALLAFLGWLWLRPQPVPPVPPEARVRAELTALRQSPETGEILSRISQALHHYLVAAFSLPPEELTTTEFCRLLNERPAIGAGLAAATSEFLRQCDERKFSPGPATAPLNAVPRALELVAQAEVRRREPRVSVSDCGGSPPLSECADGTQQRQRADANAKPPTP